MAKQTLVLVILDGWGIGKRDESNPIHVARLETMRAIEEHYPACALQASGIAVGLPWDEVGNSEVGHLTIGAGKILYQHFPKISMAIDNGSFFKNSTLLSVAEHIKKNNSALHLAGLLTLGSVHASLKHLGALLEFAKQENIKKVYLHLFTDGKDSPPQSALKILEKLNAEISRLGVGAIQTISGRYYAMDRDDHFDRVEKTYRAMTTSEPKGTIENSIKKAYENNLNDEFVLPTVVGFGKPIESNDAIVFFNFREDSMRELTRPFLGYDFKAFASVPLKNLYVATMTAYEEEDGAHVIFPKDVARNTLGKVIADAGKTQLRVAETEKYAHVTYFFNGLREKPFENEFRVLIPSRKDLKPDAHPEMMARSVTDRVLLSLGDSGFDFILANYANGDIISHTGNFDATVKAVKTVDEEVGRLVKQVRESNHILVITSDHGNAEALINLQTGEPETQHDPNPVPFYIVGKEFEGRGKRLALGGLPVQEGDLEPIGLLSDVAPTILGLMKLNKPAEMTGQNLLEQLI